MKRAIVSVVPLQHTAAGHGEASDPKPGVGNAIISPALEGGAAGDLMTRLRGGDRAALQHLVDRYWSPLVAYATGLVGAHDPAEDVVQETFIRVWRHRENWVSTGSMSAYLYRITRNLALNERRRRQTSDKWLERAGAEIRCSAEPMGPQEELAAEELRHDILQAVDALPGRRREVFILARFHGMTYREVAEVMSISPQTVANQMSAALSNMRDALSTWLVNE